MHRLTCALQVTLSSWAVATVQLPNLVTVLLCVRPSWHLRVFQSGDHGEMLPLYSVAYCKHLLSMWFCKEQCDEAVRQEGSVKQGAKGLHLAAWSASARQRHAARAGGQLLKWELGGNPTAGLGTGLAAGSRDC